MHMSISLCVCCMYACVYVCMRVYMCPICIPGACRIWKRASDCLELKLQMVVSVHVVLGIYPGPAQEQVVFLISEPQWGYFFVLKGHIVRFNFQFYHSFTQGV